MVSMPGIGMMANKRETAKMPRTNKIRLRSDRSPKMSFNFSPNLDI